MNNKEKPKPEELSLRELALALKTRTSNARALERQALKSFARELKKRGLKNLDDFI